ncbi:DUF11 domain-containing protein [Salinibacterium sp. M195]|uniref:DUF11 domain-containing protein n=1 Tax=Salinibacterium sp. M195 TaxID=2583374 RepID=UPI001C6325F0|nr:DUF11 domain-containing protein [Salinibacterium sp. M195]QYH34663.1 DUF11 domain-containing protein [Salinibacterium sp. M195]
MLLPESFRVSFVKAFAALRPTAYGLLVVAFVAASLSLTPQAAIAAPGDNPVYPDMSQSFSPVTGAVATENLLTYTLSNTTGNPVQSGLSFTNTLPVGLVVFDTTPTETCVSGSLTAVAGSSTVTWTGGIAAGVAVCTIQVSVVAASSGTYSNDTFTPIVGLNTPDTVALRVSANWGSCPTAAFLFQNQTASKTKPTEVFTVNLVTGETESYGWIDDSYINAVGYNQIDNYIWGWNVTTNSLTRVNADLTVTDFPSLGGLPYTIPPEGFIIGDVTSDGIMMLAAGLKTATTPGHNQWLAIDLKGDPDPGVPGSWPAVVGFGERSKNPPFMADWAQVSPGSKFFGVGRQSLAHKPQLLYSFAQTGTSTSTTSSAELSDIPRADATTYPEVGSWGATYAVGGLLYVSNNNSGNIWQVNVATNKAEKVVSNGPSSAGNDGARCAAAALEIDLGDAPDSYRTTFSADGPRSEVDPALQLGANISSEINGQPGVDASLDTYDDGVDAGQGYGGSTFKLTPGLAPTINVKVTNQTGAAARVAGWIDFNKDGDFLDAGEKVSANVPTGASESVIPMTFPVVPAGFAGTSYARFRIVPGTAAPAVGGPVKIGEVEDYLVEADLETELTLQKNVVLRDAASDQFTLAITGGGLSGATATTTGTDTGVQAAVVGPTTVTADGATAFTFTETAAGTTVLSNYTTTWACVDSANGGAGLGSGAGSTFALTPTPAQAPVCTFTNTDIPDDPTITIKKNITARVNASDQFTIGATGPGLVGATTTTTGTVSGVQAAQVGPVSATRGQNYTVSESAAGTANGALYTSSFQCLDLSNGNAVIASGSGRSTTFTMPSGLIPASVIECTFTNKPLAPRLTLQKNIVERALSGDQFQLEIVGGALTSATETTTGTTTGIQSVAVSSVEAVAGTTYSFRERAAETTSLSGYATTYECVDAAASDAVVASSNGTAFNYMPTHAQDVVCTFTNTPIPPTVSLVKNVIDRNTTTDQFTIAITGSGIAGSNTATTTGTTNGVQDAAVGPLAATANVVYTFAETASGTTVDADYVPTYRCVDEASASAEIASGKGRSFTYSPAAGEKVLCTFINVPRILEPSSLTVHKDVSGRAFAGDQFVITAAGPGHAAEFVPTTGTANGIQSENIFMEGLAPGSTYTIGEEAAESTDLDFYSTAWACVNERNGDSAIDSGTGRSGSFTVPEGADIVCTISNDPIPQKVTLSKTAQEPTAVRGGVITYDIVVTNTGTVHANGYTLSDPIPTGLTNFTWTCAEAVGAVCPTASGTGAINEVIAVLPPDGFVTYTVLATVLNDAPSEVLNIASFSIPECTVGGDVVTPCKDGPPVEIEAQLTVLKNLAGRASAADQLVLTATGGSLTGATATTSGSDVGVQSASVGAVPVEEGVRYSFAETAAGVTDLAFYDTTWSCIDAADGDADLGSGTGRSGSVVVPAVDSDEPSADIRCTFANDPIDGEVTLEKVANQEQATPGGAVSYTITATNSGRVHLNGTAVTDPIPSGLEDFVWTCIADGGALCPTASGTGAISETIATFPSASSVTYFVSATVVAVPPAKILNTATITNPPPGCLVDGAQASPCADTPELPVTPQISILKTTSNDSVTPRGTVAYSVTVSNTGVSAADDTVVADPIPAGLVSFEWTCLATGGAICPTASGTGAISQTIATFPVASSVVYSITATASANPPATVENVATATPPSGGTCAPGSTAPPCRSTVAISPLPVVQIAKSADRDHIVPSGSVVYSVVASNTGSVPADGSVVSDAIPTGLVSFSWTCAATGGALCPAATGTGAIDETIANFPVGSSVTYSITASVVAEPPKSVTNVALLTPPAGVCSPSLTAPPCRSEVETPSVPLVSIAKTADVSVAAPFGAIVYTVKASNVGLVNANGAIVADTIPAGITSFEWTCSAADGAVCPNARGVGAINETIATFPAGSALVFTVKATVAAVPPADIVNTALLTPPGDGQCIPGNVPGPCSSVVELPTLPAVSILKTADRTVIAVGDVVTYRVVVTNESVLSAAGTEFRDQVPSGLVTFDWTCAARGGALCPADSGTGSISEVIDIFPAGSSVIFTVKAIVAADAPMRVVNTAFITPPGVCVPNGTDDPCASTASIPRDLLAFTGSLAMTQLKLALGVIGIGASLLLLPLIRFRRRRIRAH